MSSETSTAAPRSRSRGFDKRLALETATALFWEHGYEATSVSQLCAGIGINPPSLYAAFGSKAQLFIDVLDHYERTVWDRVWDAFDREPVVIDAFRRFFDDTVTVVSAPGLHRGCLVTLSAASLRDREGDVALALAAIGDDGVRRLRAKLDSGLRDGQVPADLDTLALARAASMVVDGLAMRAHDGMTPTMLRDVSAAFLRMIPGSEEEATRQADAMDSANARLSRTRTPLGDLPAAETPPRVPVTLETEGATAMKIIGLEEFGAPDVLEVLSAPEPHAGPGQVRIRVRAAGVSPTDLMLRSGEQDPVDSIPPYVPGMDAAGVVDEVGAGSVWSLGDEVMGMALPFSEHGGAYVEHLVAPDDTITRIPDGCTLEEAATIPMNGLTATQVIELLGVAAGETIAVVGASGTLGGYVVQLAKKAGLVVIADAADGDEQLLRGLGADHVVARGAGYVDRVRSIAPGGVSGLADIATRKHEVLPALADSGAYVSVLGWKGDAQRGIRFETALVGPEYHATEKLEALRAAVEAGELTPRVAGIFPAEAAAEAHRLLAAGGVRGRFVLAF